MNGKQYQRKMRHGAAVPPGPGTYRVAEYAVLQAGMKDAGKALTMIASWLIAREGLKRWPRSIEEYSEWWGQSMAMGYRELWAFQRCFPMFEFPTELCVACKLRIPLLKRGEDDPAPVVAWLLDRKLTVAV